MNSIADVLEGRARWEPRFWAKVEKTGACWLWRGALLSCGGYGAFHLGTKNQTARAHRLSWSIANGPIPRGLFVCHKCDTPACVNPDHLFLGTNAENVADMMAKGRHKPRYGDQVRTEKYMASRKRGEMHCRAKLSAADVLSMRAEWAEGAGFRALARKYGVGYTAARSAIRGETWRSVAP